MVITLVVGNVVEPITAVYAATIVHRDDPTLSRRQQRKRRVKALLAMRVEAEARRRDRPQNLIEP